MFWKSLLAGIVVLALATAGLSYYFVHKKRPEALRLPGVVEIQEVRLGSKVGGRVDAVLALEGDVASPGQLLVRFEEPELMAQLIQQQARIAQAEADYDKAKNGPRPEEIRQTRSDLESAQADYSLAREDYARAERLFRQAAFAQADYDTARATRDRSQGRVASLKAQLDLLLAGTRPEDIAASAGRLAEARGKLKEIEANLAEANVYAPERCIIEVMSVRKGDLVPANQPIVRVLRAEDLWVRVYVPETELGKVRLQQQVTVTTDSYPGRRFVGIVFQIATESEFTPRNIQSIEERRYQVFGLKVRVDDSQGVFKAGMAAEVTLGLRTED